MRFNSIEIHQLRGIRELALYDFQDVNLLLGDNDAGKTSVLEAIMLFEQPDNIAQIIRNSRLRIPVGRFPMGRDNYLPLESLLHLFPFDEGGTGKCIALDTSVDDVPHSLAISGELFHTLRHYTAAELKRVSSGYYTAQRSSRISSRQGDEGVDMEVMAFGGQLYYDGSMEDILIDENYSYHLTSGTPRPPKAPFLYVSPSDHLSARTNSAAYRSSKRQEMDIVELLQLIDPEIEGFKLQESEFGRGINQVIEHRRFGNVPLYTYGDGMKKILTLASNVVSAKGGILLLDEIETSLQATNLFKVFSWLLQACRRFHVQLFATTHSLEAISAMAACAKADESELACFRLERYDKQTYAKRFSENALDQLVNGSGMDVR